jgi:lipopolysaccharide transport system permease protein
MDGSSGVARAVLQRGDTITAADDTCAAVTPLVVIEAAGSRVPLDVRGLREYHELLYFLIGREIKLRYKQTVLGAMWAVLQPLSAMLIFSLFLGRVAGISSGGTTYPLFAYAGLLGWTFFSNAVGNASTSLISSANLVTKVYFPRVLMPVAAVLAGLLDFAIAFVLMIVLMAYNRVPVTWHILMLPVLLGLLTVLGLAVGTWMAALNVKYRDVRYALPFLIQLWMFASPVIYPSSFVPERWRWLLLLNPVAPIIEGFRSALLSTSPFDWRSLALAAAVTAVLALYSARAFARMEESFADVI